MNYADEFRRVKTDRLPEIIDEPKDTIKSLKAVIAEKNASIDKLNGFKKRFIGEVYRNARLLDQNSDLERELTKKDVQIEKLKDTSLGFMIETAEMHAIIAQQKDKLNVLPDNFWDAVNQRAESIRQLKVNIDELNNTIEALDAEVSVRKDDSKMLMKIVEAMRLWHNDKTGSANTVLTINNILEHTDYGKLLEE